MDRRENLVMESKRERKETFYGEVLTERQWDRLRENNASEEEIREAIRVQREKNELRRLMAEKRRRSKKIEDRESDDEPKKKRVKKDEKKNLVLHFSSSEMMKKREDNDEHDDVKVQETKRKKSKILKIKLSFKKKKK